MKVVKHLFIANLFFQILFGFAFVFTLTFFFEGIYPYIRIALLVFIAVCLWDIIFLFAKGRNIGIKRFYPEKLSNGDLNDFAIQLKSNYPFVVKVRVLEEIPVRLQERGLKQEIRLRPGIREEVVFRLRPVQRGTYSFGNCNVIVQHIGLFERRFVLKEEQTLKCYPSFVQLKKYLLMATTDRLNEIGVKRIRRIGATLEFERIKEYSRGDEYRFINWKATAKANKIMVNQYEDERSQPVYSFIDKGRAMRMPFNGLTLLDYAINSSLVLSNISILKHDKAGVLTFSKDIENHVIADKRNHQMYLIAEALYKIDTQFLEPEFGKLYAYTKRNINQRSLIFLYTNFETLDALQRQLPYLKLINKSHIVIVILFRNTELQALAREKVSKSRDIYNQIVAEKFLYEKQLIIQELQSHGLQTIFTEPANLTVDSINKYLEIKARGMM